MDGEEPQEPSVPALGTLGTGTGHAEGTWRPLLASTRYWAAVDVGNFTRRSS